jgi:hypothetical protein
VILESVEAAWGALASVESPGRSTFLASDDEEELPQDMAGPGVRSHSLMEEAGGRCREEPANEGRQLAHGVQVHSRGGRRAALDEAPGPFSINVIE